MSLKKLAKEKGDATLAKLRAGEAVKELDWIEPVTVDRKTAQGLSNAVMEHVFKVNTSKLPAYDGYLDGNNAFTLLRISRVDNALTDEEAKKTAQLELESAVASEYISAFGKSLKAKTEVVVNRKLLESKE